MRCVHRYRGRRGPVFHLDCYRLRSPGGSGRSRLGRTAARRRRGPDRVAGARRRVGAGADAAVPARITSTDRGAPRPGGAVSWLALDTATDRASVALGTARGRRAGGKPRGRAASRERSAAARRSAARRGPASRSSSVDGVAAERRAGELHRASGRCVGGQGAGADAGLRACGWRRRSWCGPRRTPGPERSRSPLADALRGEVYAAAYRFGADRVETRARRRRCGGRSDCSPRALAGRRIVGDASAGRARSASPSGPAATS